MENKHHSTGTSPSPVVVRPAADTAAGSDEAGRVFTVVDAVAGTGVSNLN